MDAGNNQKDFKWSLEDLISMLWISFFCLHIGIVGIYRFLPISGDFLITSPQLPIAFFHILNAFLAPLISIIVFYVLNNAIKGVKASPKINWVTLALTLVSNTYFSLYVLTPVLTPTAANDGLLALYAEAAMMVGLVNVAVLGPLTAIVYSAEN